MDKIAESILDQCELCLTEAAEARSYVKTGTNVDYWEGWDACAHVYDFYFKSIFQVDELEAALGNALAAILIDNADLQDKLLKAQSDNAGLRARVEHLERVIAGEELPFRDRLKQAKATGLSWADVASGLAVTITTGRLKRIVAKEAPTGEQFTAIMDWLERFESQQKQMII